MTTMIWKDYEGILGAIQTMGDQLVAEAEAHQKAQDHAFQILVDSPAVPEVQVAKVAKAIKFHWRLIDYKAADGTVHMAQKDFTMVISPDGTYKRTKS